LSVGPGKEHPVVLNCHAGCDRDTVLDAMGLTWAELCAPREEQPQGEWTPRGEAVAVYEYVDEHNALLFQVCRTADKQFPQRRPDPLSKTGWTWRLGDVRRVLYRLPKIIDAVSNGQIVYIVEGEKDVHTLERLGLVATCNPGGAGKWRTDYSEHLRDADVVLIADRDDAGQAHSRQVVAALEGIVAGWRIVEAREGKDVSDHLAAGRTIDQLVETASSTQPPEVDLAPDLWEFIGAVDPPYDWVVPNLLERGDRLIWTGFEGLGKSMFTRQLAVMVAAGLNPFSARHIDPMKVLLIDCENGERQARRKFRPLAHATVDADRDVPEGGLRLIHKPTGIDLTRDDWAAWLLERVTAHRPDLLIIGPFYRLHATDMNEELAARRTVEALDMARTKVDCALVIEAHAGHGESGRTRSVRPIGSSLLLRWPEFGLGITPAEDPAPGQPCRVVEVKQWRGARDERDWPTRLTWGEPWPWVVDPRDGRQP
jgi:5S rRNA maturation endonuclease (ribonuclease M5)